MDVVTKEEKMERDNNDVSETPSFSSSLSSPPLVAAATDVIIKEDAEKTKVGGLEVGGGWCHLLIVVVTPSSAFVSNPLYAPSIPCQRICCHCCSIRTNLSLPVPLSWL